ncbi:MAG: hypothetical protein ACKOJB_07185, partial [Chthoniobacterales bacterium]
CSALTGAGIAEVWALVEKFRTDMQKSGEWSARRVAQVQEGRIEFAREQVVAGLVQSPVVQKDLNALGQAVAEGKTTLREAAMRVAGDFLRERGKC